MCSSLISPCRYGDVALLSLEDPASLLLWFEDCREHDFLDLREYPCDLITTWGMEHLLDGTRLFVHNTEYRYTVYVLFHCTLSFIQGFTVTRATPRNEKSITTLDNSLDRSETSRLLRPWEHFLPSRIQNYATLGDVSRFAGTPSKRRWLGTKIKHYRLSLTLQVSNALCHNQNFDICVFDLMLLNILTSILEMPCNKSCTLFLAV
jgi:hypothetical protein